LLHGRFLLFNPADLRQTGPDMQVSGEPVEQLSRAYRVHMNRAVGFIANPSRQTQLARFCDGEVPETDALNTAGDDPPPGFLIQLLRRLPAQWTIFSGSGRRGVASIASFTASRRSRRENGFMMMRKPSSST
jgi:hypothetical protein